VIEYKLSDDELPCTCCGKPRVKVSETVHEQLEFIPAQLFVKRHVRFVYACGDETCEANMQTAEKPAQPIEKGLAGPGLLAFIIASKLGDHLPLYRLEDILTRAGLHVSRSTLAGWMAACGRLVDPLYRRMVQRLLASHVIATDDTTTPFLDPPRDRTATGYFWSYFGDEKQPYDCYDFTRQRNRDGPEAFLGDFQGILQGDAFSGYIELAKDSRGKLVHAGCWSHARRYFDRARDKAPMRAVHEALAFIQRLYSVEHELDERAAQGSWDNERRVRERLAWRQTKSLPILDEFHEWLKKQRDATLPSSPLGEAITYTLNQWESLLVYTRDGAVAIDNNHSENVLRQQVLGRKNWLFLGREDAGHNAAILYSLVATCRRLRIDPLAYVRDVLERLPMIADDDHERLDALLPDRWIQENSEHRLQHRERESRQAAERRRDRRARRRRLAAARAGGKRK
jgi:transposase